MIRFLTIGYWRESKRALARRPSADITEHVHVYKRFLFLPAIFSIGARTRSECRKVVTTRVGTAGYGKESCPTDVFHIVPNYRATTTT